MKNGFSDFTNMKSVRGVLQCAKSTPMDVIHVFFDWLSISVHLLSEDTKRKLYEEAAVLQFRRNSSDFKMILAEVVSNWQKQIDLKYN